MKKTAFALAALALTGAGASAYAQSSVTVYGLIDTGITYNSKVSANNGSRFSVDSGDQAASRIGFKGVEDLGGGLSAIFNLENGFANDTGGMSTAGTLFDRKSVVGLSGSLGTVTLGRQTDYLEDIGSKYTSVGVFGSNAIKAAHFSNQDRVAGGARTDNSVRFDSANYSGFTGSLFYGFGEVAGKTSAGQSFGIAGNYANGPFGIGAGYYQSKLSSATTTGQPGDTGLKTFTIGSSYQFGPAKLYGAWSQVKLPTQAAVASTGLVNNTLGNKANIFDLGVDYSLTPNLHLMAGVIHDRVDIKRATTGARRASTTQINLGVDYYLSKRTDVYAMYANQRAKDSINPGVINGSYTNSPSDDSTQNVLRVGVRHKF
ncbi:MAG: Outer membrane porin protein 32 [Herbaspirillum frisingense]|uniref:Outer membrane porin protein 32 n=1 Tax=Herbaspirillum frisingense TaxID=92645 RepID=A0A7V8JUV9_9BURK|nr:MAG: Outer membrane porin protein 32 [Herbaspirillum frisingense]